MSSFQDYFVEEFVEEYKAGRMSRRDMMRRILFITGGVASAAALLTSMGVPQIALAQQQTSTSATPSTSPLSVAPNDPAVPTQSVSFPNSSDGATIMAYEARPTGASGPLQVVLVCHQNAGITPQIQDVARRWAKQGYLTCAVDLLSRNGGTAAIADPAQIPAILAAVDPNRNVSDFQAAATYYTTQPSADASRMAMNGFCFGGSITWRAAEALALKAAVPFYGSVPPLDQVPNIQAAMLGVYSSDPNDPANKSRDDLVGALTSANVTYQMNVYGETHHAFFDDTGASYNQQAAVAAWGDAVNWLKVHV